MSRSVTSLRTAALIIAAWALAFPVDLFSEAPTLEGIQVNSQSLSGTESQNSEASNQVHSEEFSFHPLADSNGHVPYGNFWDNLDSFLRNPANAGLTESFLKKYPPEAVNKFYDRVLLNSEIKAKIEGLGITTENLLALKKECKSLGKPFTLKEIQLSYPSLFSSERADKLSEFYRTVIEHLSSLDEELEQENGSVDSEVTNLSRALIDRLYKINIVNSNFEGTDFNYLSLPQLHMLSWFGIEQENQGRPESPAELQESVDFRVPGGTFRGELGKLAASALLFYRKEVSPVIKIINEDYLPVFESKIKPALQTELANDGELSAQARRFANYSQVLHNWEKNRKAWLGELNRILIKSGQQPVTDNAENTAALRERLRYSIAALTPDNRAKATIALKQLTSANLTLTKLATKIAGDFNGLYQRYKERLSDHQARLKEIEDWIVEYDSHSEDSYASNLQSFFRYLMQQGKIEQADIALQSVTSRCLDLFPDDSLEVLALRKPQDLEAMDANYSPPADTIHERRMVCFADYELRLRDAYPESSSKPFLGDGIRDLNLRLEDLITTAEGVHLKDNPNSSTISLYELSLGFLNSQPDWVPTDYEEIMKSEAEALEWALGGNLVIEKIPDQDAQQEILQLGTGVVHNLSSYDDYRYPTELLWSMPAEGELFKGCWLGLTIGDQWLISRAREQKGYGLKALLNALEPYLGEKGARAYLVQMSMRNKHIVQETHSTENVTPAVFGTSISMTVGDLKGRVGIGYGLKSEPGQTRPVIGQVKVNSLLEWEGIGDFPLEPRHDFIYDGKNGPIYQIYLPLFFIMEESEAGKIRIANATPSAQDWKRSMTEAIGMMPWQEKIQKRPGMRYSNDKIKGLSFGDVLFFNSKVILEGSGARPGSKTPGIFVIY